ncbi:hypothetical protein DICVIV_02176 [Dictyocaulus viviparus]|uniref:Uncharacterized protein n=1 Tax=Dictyocaulus viviparus TaxID=29172 RepID=A0A0D8Y4J2_DICVI|nr:hypothetical protein DICVIV_02176 [Dictyocaulus viviparus]
MLNLLSNIPGVEQGIGVVTSSGSLSDLFLQLHYCYTFLKRKKRVIIITFNLAESNYKTLFGKLTLRWDPSLISVIGIDDILESSLHIEEKDLMKSFEKVFETDDKPSLLIIDDVAALERVTKSCIIMNNKADFLVELIPVGSGFGKDVTGQMIVSVRKGIRLDISELLYAEGDRSVKCYYSGTSTFLNA